MTAIRSATSSGPSSDRVGSTTRSRTAQLRQGGQPGDCVPPKSIATMRLVARIAAGSSLIFPALASLTELGQSSTVVVRATRSEEGLRGRRPDGLSSAGKLQRKPRKVITA